MHPLQKERTRNAAARDEALEVVHRMLALDPVQKEILEMVARGADQPGPLVVLVHGSMDRSASFIRTERHLDGRHVVRYDRRGYGRSVETGAVIAVSVEPLGGSPTGKATGPVIASGTARSL